MNGKTGSALSYFLATAALVTVTQIGCGKTEEPVPVTQEQGQAGEQDQPPEITPEIGTLPLTGFAGFSTQCPRGYTDAPKALKLDEIVDCPVNLPKVELAEPLTPLLFSADCDRLTISVRSTDPSLKINSNWYLLPSDKGGTFYFTQDGLKAKLKDDGSGTANCVANVSSDIWGKVECGPGRDQAKITFISDMWLNRAPEPTNSVRPSSVPSGSPTNPNPPNGGRPDAPSVPAPINPTPTPTPSRTARAGVSSSPNAVVSGPDCKLPPTKCVFRVKTTLNQCM